MFGRVIDDLKSTPARLRERRHQLRRRARKARFDGQEAVWTWQTSALERATGLLAKGGEVPVLRRITKPAHSFVGKRFESAVAPGIEGYDGLNAKAVIAAVKELDDRVALVRVRRHEQANKARKTVLAAVEKALVAVDEVPVVPEVVDEVPEAVPA